MKRPASPCVRRRKQLRRLHPDAATAPLRRKRAQDCGFYRTLGPPPEKRPRLEVVDSHHAFLWEIQATPKEPTFGKDAKHKQHKNGNGGAATAVTGLAQQTSPMDAGGPQVPDKLELLSAELTGGPPLPADAAMELSSPPGSDEDNPAFNAFNYWKTPFPDVSADVIME